MKKNYPEFHLLDYNYLRPSLAELSKFNEYLKINHKNITTNHKEYNQISFYCREFTKLENVMIYNVIHNMQEKHIYCPLHWTSGDIIRFLTLYHYNINKTTDGIKKHFDWMNMLSNFELSEQASQILRNGNVYIGNRAKDGNPILIVSLSGIENINAVDIKNGQDALIFVMMIIIKYMMFGGYCESYHLFIDLNKTKTFGVDCKFLKSLVKTINDNFYRPGGRTFVYNPEKSFNITWNIIKEKKFIDEDLQKDITFIAEGLEDEFQQLVDLDHWEQRFGGKMDNINKGQFWPPEIKTKKKGNGGTAVTKNYIFEKGLYIFWMFDFELDKRFYKFESHASQMDINIKLQQRRLVINNQLSTINPFSKEGLEDQNPTNNNSLYKERAKEKVFQKRADFIGKSKGEDAISLIISSSKASSRGWYGGQWDKVCGCCCSKKYEPDSRAQKLVDHYAEKNERSFEQPNFRLSTNFKFLSEVSFDRNSTIENAVEIKSQKQVTDIKILSPIHEHYMFESQSDISENHDKSFVKRNEVYGSVVKNDVLVGDDSLLKNEATPNLNPSWIGPTYKGKLL